MDQPKADMWLPEGVERWRTFGFARMVPVELSSRSRHPDSYIKSRDIPAIIAQEREKWEAEVASRIKISREEIDTARVGWNAALKSEAQLRTERDQAKAQARAELREPLEKARAALRDAGCDEQFRVEAFHAVADALSTLYQEGESDA